MVASEDEFLSHKDRIVEDVQDKLRHLARIEAELLFREFNANGREIALPQISNRISQAIIRTHDAIYNMLEQEDQSTGLLADNSDTTRSLLMDHLPGELRSVVENSTDMDARIDRIPLTYRRNIIASSLSSRIVYAEGLGFVERVQDAVLGDVVKRYIGVVDDVSRLSRTIENCEGMSAEDKEDLVRLLGSPGIAAAMSS
jgi:glutamate dehydrogenase